LGDPFRSTFDAMTILAVDCMGGDHGPRVTLAACRRFLASQPDAHLLLVGAAESLRVLDHPRAKVIAATEVIAMDDSVEVALRKKKDSSMRVAIQQVKHGHAHAAVSAGNTGALMALARYLLKTVDGIDRPAIAYPLPNAKGGATTVLDLGANVDCTEHHLLQFAVMGSALVSALNHVDAPTVGLLNIGEEAIKGSEVIKKAGELLRAAAESGDLNFFGNVEGNDIFKGTTDIVVCDGFVGNVALKTSEGLASMIGGFLKEEFSRNIFTKLAALAVYPVLSAFKNRVDYRRYNGAALLGLRGLVFKSHGSADEFAFEQALNRAYDAARNNLLDRVQSRIAHARPLLAASDEPVPLDAVTI
jgi:glycerol-3-phosphate acyltransferase PlsX